ncbi:MULTISPECIES: hypothetical protein [unclassified Streptomyces]|uniref:hypothetical protein n=1 Tax=unclassified Streptomyces TaxID=2593676 RepID=UPI000AE123B1|nr:hypothetical protein [Streptomyces sp. AVP053U2]
MTGHDKYGCGGIGSWYHKLARAGLYVCPTSPIPPGFRATTGSANQCSGLGGRLLVNA